MMKPLRTSCLILAVKLLSLHHYEYFINYFFPFIWSVALEGEKLFIIFFLRGRSSLTIKTGINF